MKTIYKAGGITEAHIVAGMLEAQGIQSHVGGHHLQGGVGEVATMDFARVWVADEDHEAAQFIIDAYEQHEPDKSESGLQHEKPAVSMGIFTKPILFWVSVCLLIVWFIF